MRAGSRGGAGGFRTQRRRGDGLRRLPRWPSGQRGRTGALCQPEHGAFHGAALRAFHRGAAEDRKREDRKVQAQDLGRAKPRDVVGSRGGRTEAGAVRGEAKRYQRRNRTEETTMQEGTLVRLLPRRAILAPGAAIMMAALPARAQEAVSA